MKAQFHETIRAIAEALYRSTGAVPLVLTIADVQAIAKSQTLPGPLTDAECLQVLDSLADNLDTSDYLGHAITNHLDMQAEATHATTTLIRDIELKLTELQGAVSIAVTGGNE
ncbi:MAG: hypothetical protein AB7F35_10485 [Acetobacteraceae bacterium]